MTMSSLEKYIDYFGKLKVNTSGGFKAPHKAILMITITEMVRDGKIPSFVIEKNSRLRTCYYENWSRFIQINTPFVCNVDMPFQHMGSEPFCKSLTDEVLRIDEELYEAMSTQEDAQAIITTLIANYLAPFAYKHKVDFSELNPYKDKTLRDYQVDAKEKIYKMWIQKRSIMFQMPTGTGKTRLFASVARDLVDWGAERKIPVKILILAHRIELIDQIDEHIGYKYNLAHALIVSKSIEQKRYPVQIGSVPTLTRRLSRWADKDFDIIIIDEAHHVKAESYRKILKEFPRAKVLGVTATPYRMNGASFHPEFDDLIVSQPVINFIKQKWLCEYQYYSIHPSSRVQRDIDSIRRFALDGDYLDIDMMNVMDRAEIRAGIVECYEKYALGKKGIVYTINRSHNEHVCSRFIERGYNAVAIDSETPADERAKLVEDFRNGKIDIICNVNIFSEGFDCPDVDFIQLARPTKSLSMYLQQVGRGLRPAKGKDHLIILDNVGLYNRFGFPSARRHWRYHFEGRPVDYTPNHRMHADESRMVYYMDDFAEGNESVEMLHTSLEETPAIDIPVVEEDIYKYEPDFKYYLERIGIPEHSTDRLLKGIKEDVDLLIKSRYDSKHKSLLFIDDLPKIELYRQEFEEDSLVSELNVYRKHIFTESIRLYEDFIRWIMDGRQEEAFIPREGDTNHETIVSEFSNMSIGDLRTEINIFMKYGAKVPDALRNELLKRELEMPEEK